MVDLVHRIKEINEHFKEESEAELKQVRSTAHDNLMKSKEDVLHLKTELSDRLNEQATKLSQLEGSQGVADKKLSAEVIELKQVVAADREANN